MPVYPSPLQRLPLLQRWAHAAGEACRAPANTPPPKVRRTLKLCAVEVDRSWEPASSMKIALSNSMVPQALGQSWTDSSPSLSIFSQARVSSRFRRSRSISTRCATIVLPRQPTFSCGGYFDVCGVSEAEGSPRAGRHRIRCWHSALCPLPRAFPAPRRSPPFPSRRYKS